jgi:hypothetical protein
MQNCFNSNPCQLPCPCDSTKLYTECGFVKLMPGYGIRLTSNNDLCSLTIASFAPAAAGVPTNAEGFDGDLRIDSTNHNLYFRSNGVWYLASGSGGSGLNRYKEQFLATDTQTVFTLSGTLWQTSSADNIDVYRNGVLQDIGGSDDYTYLNGVITFNEPMVTDEKVTVIYFYS